MLASPHRLRSYALIAIVFLLGVGCAEQTRSDHQLTAEEEVLLARLTRDSGVVVVSWSRNPDSYVEVLTNQGNLRERYIFKPDRPGERVLNIHHIDDAARLETQFNDHPGNGAVPNVSGRSR